MIWDLEVTSEFALAQVLIEGARFAHLMCAHIWAAHLLPPLAGKQKHILAHLIQAGSMWGLLTEALKKRLTGTPGVCGGKLPQSLLHSLGCGAPPTAADETESLITWRGWWVGGFRLCTVSPSTRTLCS